MISISIIIKIYTKRNLPKQFKVRKFPKKIKLKVFKFLSKTINFHVAVVKLFSWLNSNRFGRLQTFIVNLNGLHDACSELSSEVDQLKNPTGFNVLHYHVHFVLEVLFDPHMKVISVNLFAL